MDEDQTANVLAAAHRHEDTNTTTVKYFPTPGTVRLVEVSSSAPTTGEILPFQFNADAANGIPFPSIVILVSPHEWAQIQSGTLQLPAGWDLKTARDL